MFIQGAQSGSEEVPCSSQTSSGASAGGRGATTAWVSLGKGRPVRGAGEAQRVLQSWCEAWLQAPCTAFLAFVPRPSARRGGGARSADCFLPPSPLASPPGVHTRTAPPAGPPLITAGRVPFSSPSPCVRALRLGVWGALHGPGCSDGAEGVTYPIGVNPRTPRRCSGGQTAGVGLQPSSPRGGSPQVSLSWGAIREGHRAARPATPRDRPVFWVL